LVQQSEPAPKRLRFSSLRLEEFTQPQETIDGEDLDDEGWLFNFDEDDENIILDENEDFSDQGGFEDADWFGEECYAANDNFGKDIYADY
jgi:hypothetical protein